MCWPTSSAIDAPSECPASQTAAAAPPPGEKGAGESFQFRLHKMLSCDCECRFCKLLEANQCGAIVFEYAPPEGAAHRHPSSAPLYVVAFRGTITKPLDLSAIRDIYLDGNVLLNQQHRCHDFLQARKQVRDLLEKIAGGNGGTSGAVWLAGHSLGASIALDVGRDLASREDGCHYLPTFLFNPPQISPAPVIDKLPMEPVAKRDLLATSYLVKHVLGKTVMRPHKKRMESLFKQLSPWVPNLYVNPRDPFCSGFIDYFEQRELTREWSTGVAASAAMLSYRDMGYSVLGKQNDQPHLLPSAVVWKNQRPQGDAHKLRQWWKHRQDPELELSSKRYCWP